MVAYYFDRLLLTRLPYNQSVSCGTVPVEIIVCRQYLKYIPSFSTCRLQTYFRNSNHVQSYGETCKNLGYIYPTLQQPPDQKGCISQTSLRSDRRAPQLLLWSHYSTPSVQCFLQTHLCVYSH